MDSKSQMANRRSSIRNDPLLQEKLRGIQPFEVFKNVFQAETITRLSENSTRLSLNKPRPSGPSTSGRKQGSCIPTPSSSAARPTSSAKSNDTGSRSRSRQPPSQAPLKRHGVVARLGPQHRSSSVSTVDKVGFGSSSGMKPPLGRSSKALSQTCLSSLNSTRRKSISYESLIQTPAFTPRSRSKSPGSVCGSTRRGVINDAGDQGKNIKITKDRKSLAEMAKYVYEFLDSQGCQAKPPQWQDLVVGSNLSIAKINLMFKFVASHFVGDSFFAKTAKGDDMDKIVEVAKLLKYSGPVTKSHLKTANAQHAWPSCLTLLAWFCCRAKGQLDFSPEPSGIDALNSNGIEEFALESYLNLFPLHFTGTLSEDRIAEELVLFKARVQDTHGVEVGKSKDELINERNERKIELEKLLNAVDPSKDLKDRFEQETATLKEIKDKIKEAETSCKKFSDTNHLTLQCERIQLEIQARKKDCMRLKNQVESQPITKSDASSMVNETKAFKAQLESLANLIAQLKSERESRVKKVEDLRKQLYELCTSFSVVEEYNELARAFDMKDSIIPPNPFAANELEVWMKESSKTLRRADTRVNDIVHQVEVSSDKKNKERMEYIQHVTKLETEVDDLKRKLQASENYLKFVSADCEKKEKEMLNKLSEATSKFQEEQAKYKEAEDWHDQVSKHHEGWKEDLEEYQAGVVEWKEKEELEYQKLLCEQVKSTEFYLNALVETSERYRKFVLEHFKKDEPEEQNNAAKETDAGKE